MPDIALTVAGPTLCAVGGELFRLGAGDDGRGDKSPSVHPYCRAITALFSRPGFRVSDGGFAELMDYHRWLAIIFAVSDYRHGDHTIRATRPGGRGGCPPDPERG